MNTVGANDNVAVSGRAILELNLDAVAMLRDPDTSMVKMNYAVGNRRR